MGILDYLSNPNVMNQLMMAGEAFKAADQSRPANLAPFMERSEQLQGQERMNKMRQKLVEGGILQKLLEKRGYSPEAYGVLTSALEAAPGAVLPQVLGMAFPQNTGDPYARYKVVGGRLVDLAAEGGPGVVVDGAGNDWKIPTGYRMKADGSGIERIPGYEPKRGDTIRLADGTEINLDGGAGTGDGNIPLNRSATNEVEKSILTSDRLTGMMGRLRELAGIGEDGKLSPEARKMFTYGGRIEGTLTNIQDKLDLPDWVPIIGGAPDPKAREFLERRTRVVQVADQLFNEYRKEITGAAAAVQELDRLKKSFLNSEMGPTEFEAAFNEYVNTLDRSRKTAIALRTYGIDPSKEANAEVFNRVYNGEPIEQVVPGAAKTGATGGSPLSEMSDEEILKGAGLK